MRIILKGGVWKNTEDEILKAAVMKYGKNQWARISSLLNRKSPKQCKARWYEWLDPSIKKTEWSKEEDEKLLHLAKLMPTQWRTIAPIVGRTPTQCLERYQKLLDEAEQREVGADMADVGAVTAEDIRRLRPGEIDPDPETKPARPDPIDMDEDEKEMLSEARARLANTQGKKAKRKARERQLEESRRLASLQKRRELKAAGVNWKLRVRKGEINYNTEVPFQIRAPSGFFDTAEEKVQNAEAPFKPIKLSDIEPKTRAQQEEEHRRADMKKRRQTQEKGNAAPNIAAVFHQLEPAVKRRKMQLPAPQLTENELEEIVKIGQTQDSLFNTVDSGGEAPTSGLISAPDAARPFTQHIQGRTPASFRTPAPVDAIQAEAANLLALQNTATPLLGGNNRELQDGGTGFGGITPARVSAPTPNRIAENTPLRSNVAGQTPLRSNLIDVARMNSELATGDDFASRLKFGLSSLPKPKNDFEIVVPDQDEDVEEISEIVMDIPVEDRADIEERDKLAREQELQKEFARRTQVRQRKLPRPNHPVSIDITPGEISYETELIYREAGVLLRHDFFADPPANADLSAVDNEASFDLDFIPDQYMEQAKVLLSSATESNGFDHSSISEGHTDLFLAEQNRWLLTVSPETGAFKFIEGSAKNLDSFRADFQSLKHPLAVRSKGNAKLQVRLAKILGGYVQRSQQLTSKLKESSAKLEQLNVELATFRRLREQEQRRAEHRVHRLSKEVKQMENIESETQAKYQRLLEATKM